MKKKNHSVSIDQNLGFGLAKKETDKFVNSDLDCVMADDYSRTSSQANQRKRLDNRSQSHAVEHTNIRQKEKQFDKIPHNTKNEKAVFKKIKRGFQSAIDVVDS